MTRFAQSESRHDQDTNVFIGFVLDHSTYIPGLPGSPDLHDLRQKIVEFVRHAQFGYWVSDVTPDAANKLSVVFTDPNDSRSFTDRFGRYFRKDDIAAERVIATFFGRTQNAKAELAL